MSPAESDTDPYQLESCCIQEETSSGSLLPIVSMMQATDARECNQTCREVVTGREESSEEAEEVDEKRNHRPGFIA
jgi:hypothetical protein